ncbi:hypothetical protein ACU4GD_11055 [Cupriavidus basilensis]
MVFAKLVVEVRRRKCAARGIEKPIVWPRWQATMQVEEAAEYLYEHGVPSYAYLPDERSRSRCWAPPIQVGSRRRRDLRPRPSGKAGPARAGPAFGNAWDKGGRGQHAAPARRS